MKAKILDVSYDRYLADDIGAKTPTLNASVAKVLIQKSPAHAVLAHPKFNPNAEEATKAMDKGSILHSLLLNIGKGVQVVAHDNWRTKAAQMERDEARDDGYIPLLLREAEEIQQASMHISRNIVELGIHLDEGMSEFMIHWESDGVQCRRSLDNWQDQKLQIIELKSIFSAHPEVCESQAAKLRYDIEYAASLDAMYSLYPDLAGRIDFVFVFVEIEPPYAVMPLRPDGTFTHRGIQGWQRAKEIWKQCLESNHWPSYLVDPAMYPDRIGRLSAPMWAVKQEMEGEYEQSI